MTFLLIVVLTFAYLHSKMSNAALDISLSAVTPTQTGLRRIDALLAESDSFFLRYVGRDPVTGADCVDILNRLVAAEKKFVASLPRKLVNSETNKYHARIARTAFHAFLDEETVEVAGDTTNGLKQQVSASLTRLRASASSVTNLPRTRAQRASLMVLMNLLTSSEAMLDRYFGQNKIEFDDVLRPLETAMKIYKTLPLKFLHEYGARRKIPVLERCRNGGRRHSSADPALPGGPLQLPRFQGVWDVGDGVDRDEKRCSRGDARGEKPDRGHDQSTGPTVHQFSETDTQ